jgi:antitoxin VapB
MRFAGLSSLACFGYPYIQAGIFSSLGATAMPLYIKDDATAELVRRLAEARGVSKQGAVRLAVEAELKRMAEAIPLRQRIAEWRKDHPLPPPTGQRADKAFFDDLSGEL